MPIAALIGTIYALSKLAANSEFTIMRVSGMSTGALLNSVLIIGLGLVALTYVLGEFLSPPAEQLAQRVRLKATGSQISVRDFRSGVWVRDVLKAPGGGVEAFRFINVTKVSPDGGTTQGWRISSSIASTGCARSRPRSRACTRRAWDGVTNVVETRLPQLASGATERTNEGTQVIRDATRAWRSELRPDIFGVLMVQPSAWPAWTSRSTSTTWPRTASRPRSTRSPSGASSSIHMGGAGDDGARPAVRVPTLVRAGGLSLKIFTGVMIGVGFYGLNKLFAHLAC